MPEIYNIGLVCLSLTAQLAQVRPDKPGGTTDLRGGTPSVSTLRTLTLFQQAELSTLEMRQSVPALLAKLKKHRPRVLCFVGKKIWDEFEAVISKSVQRPTQADTKTDEPKVKIEADQADVGTSGSRQNSQAPTPRRQTFAVDAVQMYALDPEGKLVAGSGLDTMGTSPSGPVTPVKKPTTPKPTKILRTPKTPKVAAAPWRWDEPRPYKYVYPPSEDKPVSTDPCACYFWVVPSTSGLERTLVRCRARARLTSA